MVRTVHAKRWILGLAGIVFLCSPAPVLAQSFLTPLRQLAGDATLVTRAGEEVEGSVRMWSGSFKLGELGRGGIAKLQFKEPSGEKRWFEVADIERLSVKLDLQKSVELLNEHSSSLENFIKAARTDFSELAEREYTIYEPVEVKTEVYRLHQLMNPGFDSKIKVYYLVTGSFDEHQEIANSELSNLTVVKADRSQIKVKEGKYKKRYFEELYGDCEMMMNYPADERQFKYFAEHVYVYDQVCE